MAIRFAKEPVHLRKRDEEGVFKGKSGQRRYSVSVATESVHSSVSGEAVEHQRGTKPAKRIKKGLAESMLDGECEFASESGDDQGAAGAAGSSGGKRGQDADPGGQDGAQGAMTPKTKKPKDESPQKLPQKQHAGPAPRDSPKPSEKLFHGGMVSSQR